MKFISTIAIASVAVLAGCGGTTTNGFDVLLDKAETLAAATELYALTPESYDLVGSARYKGLAAITEYGTPTMGTGLVVEEVYYLPTYLAVGTGNVLVDFDAGTATGGASGFYEIDLASVDLESDTLEQDGVRGTAIDGSFELTSEGYEIVGSLIKADGEEASYQLFVDAIEYYGPEAEELFVYGSGSSSAPGRVIYDSEFVFDGIK